MGYIRHNAIVVTCWDISQLEPAIDMAKELKLQIIGPSKPVTNGYSSFLICPDGSKEGWEDSDDGDYKRDQFWDWINKQMYADGSSTLECVEVAYGNDGPNAVIVTAT